MHCAREKRLERGVACIYGICCEAAANMSSKNICLEATGAQVVFSTSFDPQHPPEAVIDGCVLVLAAAHSPTTTHAGRRARSG